VIIHPSLGIAFWRCAGEIIPGIGTFFFVHLRSNEAQRVKTWQTI
jgi:hypothetical protein